MIQFGYEKIKRKQVMNKVLRGAYAGKDIYTKGVIDMTPYIHISGTVFKKRFYFIDDGYIKSWELVDSRADGLSRGAGAVAGALFWGATGAIVGSALGNSGIHTIGLRFSDGKKSLIAVDSLIFEYFSRRLGHLESNAKADTFMGGAQSAAAQRAALSEAARERSSSARLVSGVIWGIVIGLVAIIAASILLPALNKPEWQRNIDAMSKEALLARAKILYDAPGLRGGAEYRYMVEKYGVNCQRQEADDGTIKTNCWK